MRTRAGVDGSSAVAASAARPLGLALLDEGLGALDAVLGGAKQRGEVALEPDAVGQRKPEAADDGLLGVAQRDRRLLRDLAGEGLRGDPDVAGQRELEPAAQREAADGRDDRLWAALHLGPEIDTPARLAEVGRRRRLEELADVGTGAEGALAAARDHDR